MNAAGGPEANQLANALGQRIGAGHVLVGAEAAPYCTDWRRILTGQALAVIRPGTADEVAACVALCAAQGVSVVAQGGNTGLCGGATPSADGTQIVLSLARLRQIRDLDPVDMTLTVEAGLTLQEVRDAAAASGAAFPLSIAAQGSAQLGGILSTNAGGINTLRYGNARDLVLGLEVVLADGRIWNGLRRLRKDNTGYALRHLFLGAEGTLGIITAAVLRLVPQTVATELAFVAVPRVGAALELLRLARQEDEAAMRAFEYISGEALRMVVDQIDACSDPLPSPSPHYILIELGATRPNAPLRQTLEAILEQALAQNIVTDAVLAGSDAQRAALWRLREDQAEAQHLAGPNVKNDISVPISSVPALIAQSSAACAELLPGLRIVPFGHLGDGNIHFNLVAPTGAEAAFEAKSPALAAAVTEIARKLGGSFSAEHGIGQLKTGLLADWRSGTELDVMHALKAALDPAGIFNPGKLLIAGAAHS